MTRQKGFSGVDTPEVPLAGGTANTGLVVRVGDTVRRPLRPTSAATHALLRHLEHVGFSGAPRWLGVDDRGREVLSYVPGSAVTPPYPRWALQDDALVSVARLLRRYHEAVRSFDPAPHRWSPTLPPSFRGEGLVSHSDLNLDNIVFRDGQAVALIDFDLAAPGSRCWDVACASRLWAPLRSPVDVDDARRARALARFRIFVRAYGPTGATVESLVEAVRANHEWLYDIVGAAAVAGHPGFSEYWTDAAAARVERTRRWLADNGGVLQAVLA
ncbi:MAG TPA: phosphotransferase [Actinomycetales bacterium]|nr:phosphotransferase [Actinomycetales bacterium]